MIKVTKATRAQIKNFNEKEWHGVDLEHYGKHVHWNEKNFIFKAVENEKIVGTITGKHEAGVIYVGTIIVSQDKRGSGIGQKLLAKAESFGKKLGAHKIWLITGKGWRAEEFYDKIGFRLITVLPNHHFHKDFAIYEKDID